MDSGSLFSHFICRVGGISSDTFGKLRSKHTHDHLRKLFSLEIKINTKKEVISKLLFNEIPLITDNKNRNFLLNVKRELYNTKVISNEKQNRVSKIVSPNLQKHIINYRTLLIDKQKIENEIENSYSTEVITIRKKFKSYLRNSDFQKGLLISSNSLYKTQELYFKSSNSKTNGRLEQIERGLLRYFSRMAMKATPFGTFCSVIPGEIIQSSKNNNNSSFIFNGNPELKESLLQINKGLYGNIIEHCKNRNEIRKWFNLELNPTINNSNNKLLFLTAKDGKEIFQKLPNNPVIKLLINELQKLSLTSYNELIKFIASYKNIDADEKEVANYIDKLIEIGFIRFKIGISEQEINWAEKLKNILLPIEDSHAKTITNLIELLIDKTRQFKDSGVIERREILNDLKEKIKTSFKEMNITLDLLTELPFYEDATANCKTEIIANRKLDTIEENLKKYITITRKLAYPILEQINMRHFYENKYTSTEKDVPLLQFYEDYYREHYKNHTEKQEKLRENKYKNKLEDDLKNFDSVNPFNLKIIDKIQEANKSIKNLIIQKWIDNPNTDEIRIDSKELIDLTVNLPEVPKPHSSASFFSQLISTNSDGKELCLLLNNGKYFLGYGKYFSRFLYLFSEAQQYEIYKKNNEATEMILAEICGDANFNANLHPPLVTWEISYPTSEGGLAEHELNTTDILVEKHYGNKTMLRLKHKPTGKYITPLDLGFLSPMLRPPLFQLLSKFSPPSNYSLPIPEKPFIEIRKKNKTRKKEEEKNKLQITYRPRIIFNNNIVLARKCWIVQAQVFPAILQNEEEYKYFIRINMWIKQHNIPEEVYIRINILPTKEQIDIEDSKSYETNEKSIKETTKIKNTEKKDGMIEDEKIDETDPKEKNTTKKLKQNKMSRDFHKPQYIDFRNPLLVNLFGKMTVNIKNYTISIEERYPSNETLPEYNGKKFTSEQIFQMNFPDCENN